MSQNSIETLARAYHFAATRHASQRRKGAAKEPYMNHLTEVADLVAQATGGADLDLVLAALLHDAVEDTDTTLAELAANFGDRVAGLVAELTDDKSLPEEVQKDLQEKHAVGASPGAKIIKIADKTSNVRSLPEGWSETRRAEYVAWCRRVVDVCRPANVWLAAQFDAAVGPAM